MLQLPLLSATRIRGAFQREREPQGQYGIEAVNEVSIATRDSGPTQEKRTSYMHFRREVETVSCEPLSLKLITHENDTSVGIPYSGGI